jgi:hypothetical protein
MFKATHKRRATTLSKTLLTAGLLGGAALSTLAAGSAQAASEQRDCSFGDSIAHTKCRLINWATGWKLGDKELKNLTYFSDPELIAPPSGTFSFIWDELGRPGYLDDEWTTLATFDPAIGPPDTGSYSYNLAITETGWYFNDVELDSDHVGSGTIATKLVEDALGGDIAYLESINGIPDGPDPTIKGYTSIKVTDSWVIDPNAGKISSISNSFTQVPAPLPLLGAGAVLGSIRKLRKFSSQLKTFSMG